MAIVVVSIPVTDQRKGRDFYRDVMGFTVMRDEAMGPEMRWIQMQPKDGGSSIALVTWFEGLKPGGQQGLMVGVDDIDAEHARLTERWLGLSAQACGSDKWIAAG